MCSLIDSYIKDTYPIKKGNLCQDLPFVYVFYNLHNRLYKIGISQDVDERLKTLSRQSGSDIDLIGFIELEQGVDESSRYIERYLHNWFKDKRVVGEWFRLDLLDLENIRDLMYKIDGIEVCFADCLIS